MIIENVGTVIVSAIVSLSLGLITYFGANKRAQIDAGIAAKNIAIAKKKAEDDAKKAESDLELKLAERVDRLRLKLWDDVEEKMAKQAERIVAQDALIAEEVKARKKLETIVEKQAEQLIIQAEQIRQLEGELKEKDALIARLKNGGSDYKPASL